MRIKPDLGEIGLLDSLSSQSELTRKIESQKEGIADGEVL